MEWAGPAHLLSSGCGVRRGSCMKPGSHWCRVPSAPPQGKANMCSSWAEFRIPIALLLVPPALQPARGLLSPMSDPRTEAQPAHSPGQVSTCVSSNFLWVPSQGHRSWPDCLFSLPMQFFVYLSYSLGCTGVFLQVSSYFSVRVLPHVDVFWMFCGGTNPSKMGYSTILVDLQGNSWYPKYFGTV